MKNLLKLLTVFPFLVVVLNAKAQFALNPVAGPSPIIVPIVTPLGITNI
jgi:hypothetical protein